MMFLLALLVTLVVNVPIDNEIRQWTIATLPSDWGRDKSAVGALPYAPYLCLARTRRLRVRQRSLFQYIHCRDFTVNGGRAEPEWRVGHDVGVAHALPRVGAESRASPSAVR